MKWYGWALSLSFGLALMAGCATYTGTGKPTLPVEASQWHAVTITFDGPQTSEYAEVNPFLDYRLDVTFSDGTRQFAVPGYYAADGDAAETSAKSGGKWRVHFVPDRAGRWIYRASFRMGQDIAVSDDPNAGQPLGLKESRGAFVVKASGTSDQGSGLADPRPPTPDPWARGMLRYVGKRYLQYAQTGEPFIKAGADSPENLLGYADFDDTSDTAGLPRPGEAKAEKFIHRYAPHVQDWRPGDPAWKNGKGRGLIGGLNYLASKGVNSVYFLTYNLDGGDGKDVWPWTDPNERLRFDCSKLDQWEIVFSHMDRLGIQLHVVTQETENDQALDGGDLGKHRKLYYRELIARFAHHLAVVWNLGEENSNTDAQRKAFCKYIKDLDPYDHPIVCHTFPGQYDAVYGPLLGYAYFDGVSLQTTDTHAQTIRWIDRSARVGRQWFVCLDEIAQATTGVRPDTDDYWHDDVRKQHLWGNLMAGGAGVEWYFGYMYAHNDLNCENWRSRDHLWLLTQYAVQFFRTYVPFTRMTHHDELTSADNDYCLAEPGEVYAVYLPGGGTTQLDLGRSTAKYQVRWYDPRTGGILQRGTVELIGGPGPAEIGQPPADTDKDWVALVTRVRQ